MQYPSALITLDYIDVADVLAALPTRLWPMQSRYAVLLGCADHHALAMEMAR